MFTKGSPFGIIFRHPFLADHPQNFSKSALGANITNVEGGGGGGGGGGGERVPKNCNFLVKKSKKLKTRFFWPELGKLN